MSRIVLLAGAATLAALVPAGLGLAANPSLSASTPVAPSLVRSTVDPSTGTVEVHRRGRTAEPGDDHGRGRTAEPGDDHDGSGRGGHGSDDAPGHG
jgi:hypothetical protein